MNNETIIVKHQGKPRKVHLIDHSIAFTDGDGEIYINKNLKSYSELLYDRILQHELEHEDGSYSVHDLEHDMSSIFPFKQRVDFCKKYPKALYYMSPVVITEEKVMISWMQVFTYLALLSALIALIIWLGPYVLGWFK